MNDKVTDYINHAPEEHKLIMQKIRELVHQCVPSVREEFKWSRPIFSTERDFAYLKSAKGYVTLGFLDSDKLKEDIHLLEGTGKDMRHIHIREARDIDGKLLTKWFRLLTNQV